MAEAAPRRRIGVFGGAFDPPHLAHEALLRCAVTELALDELRVIPTGQAWHTTRTLTAPEHRLAMAQLAFAQVPKVTVDAQEINRNGPSYTIDTLHGLALSESGAEWFLIMGADQAAALTNWRSWQEILQIATICVADRGDSKKLYPARFFHLKMPALAISATQIRAMISAGQSAETLVSKAVARYIATHHLYQ
jgi:nicotinate-nucleotide adenylyltransferase